MKDILHYGIFLLVLSALAGIGLHGVNELTKERIAVAQRRNLADGQKQIFARAATFSEEKHFPMAQGSGTYYEVYSSSGALIGYELLTAKQGYQSLITVLTGVTTNGVLTGIKVLTQAETPGLGAEVEAIPASGTLWQALAGLFRSGTDKKAAAGPVVPPFQAQFSGKRIEQLAVVKQPDPQRIEALSGATITSAAVTKAVREPLEALMAHLRGRH